MIAYIVTFISAIFALGVGTLGGYLSFNLIKDVRDDSTSIIVGWILLIISLAYTASPTISIILIKSDRIGWSYIYNILSILISIALIAILISSLEAAARP